MSLQFITSIDRKRSEGVVEGNKAIKEMYINIKKSVKVKCMRLELFDIKVGVYQGSVVSLLPVALMIDEMTKDI